MQKQPFWHSISQKNILLLFGAGLETLHVPLSLPRNCNITFKLTLFPLTLLYNILWNLKNKWMKKKVQATFYIICNFITNKEKRKWQKVHTNLLIKNKNTYKKRNYQEIDILHLKSIQYLDSVLLKQVMLVVN